MEPQMNLQPIIFANVPTYPTQQSSKPRRKRSKKVAGSENIENSPPRKKGKRKGKGKKGGGSGFGIF